MPWGRATRHLPGMGSTGPVDARAPPRSGSVLPHVTRSVPSMKRYIWIPIVLAAVAAAGAAWFLRTRPLRTDAGIDVGNLPRGVSRDRLNLVVITLDTTRADRIGAYGARDVETPAIDHLADEGVLFEQAVSA